MCDPRSIKGPLGLVTASAAILFATAVDTAVAADRYVTPSGTPGTCTLPSPCDLESGINNATSADTVHVVGEYLGVTAFLSANGPTVIGEGAQTPRIVFGVTGQFIAYNNSSLTRLELSRTSGAPLVLQVVKATASRLTLESGTGLPLQIEDTVLRDSFVRQTGESLPAIQALGNNSIRNVTALATAPGSTAIRTSATENFLPPPDCFSSGTLTLSNSIARGVAYDLASTGTAKCPGPINVDHSNYRAGKVLTSGTGGAINDLGSNQTGVEPLLTEGGYRQLQNSPTIDAGVDSSENGAVDLDGEARFQGTAPDIGADEYPSSPPSPSPSPALDTIAPVGSKMRFKPKRFRTARKRAPSVAGASAKKHAKRSRRTSRVSYRLTEAASVRFFAQRRIRGRRRGKRCLTGKRARRLRKARKCHRFIGLKGGFGHVGTTGRNSFRFSGFIRNRRLPPGAYRLVGVPTDAAGNRGSSFGAPFFIARR